MAFDGKLAVQVAIVTVSARGIGRTITDALVARGARVHVFDMNDRNESAGILHRVNVADAQSVADAVVQLPEPATLLVNNAGITRDRSLLNIGMLVALRATGELRGHVRGGLRNGLTREEITEAVIHTAGYCGAPAALSAMKVVQEVLVEELGPLQGE